MADTGRNDPVEVLDLLGSHWGWLLGFGIVSVLAGLAALFWPGETVLVLGVIFGIQLVVSGVFELVEALSAAYGTSGARWLTAILGGLSIVVGIILVRHILLSVLVLGLVLGIYWIVHGVMRVFAAAAHREMPGRGWVVVAGVLSVIAGVIVLAFPVPSLVLLAIVLGIWLIVYGLIEIVAAFRLRSARQRAPVARPQTT
jgi:uncharacterized membrane protein HdeD (DUF308 family)